MTRGGLTDTTSVGPYVPHVVGQWKGDRLEVKQEDGHGFKMTENYTLDDKGRSLEVRTKVEARHTFEIKRVYEKVGGA